MSAARTTLVGSVGTGTAFAAVTALRRHWPSECRIVGQDTNPAHLVTASLLCDEFVRCPLSADPGFLKHLLTITEKSGVDTYVPLMPVELSLVRKHATELERRGITLVAADRHSETDASDKWAVVNAALAHGIPVPRTALEHAPDGLEEVFAKPRFGVGSKGAVKLSGADYRAMPESDRHGLVFQQVCDGPEVTVDAFVHSPGGAVHALARERIEVKAGVCVKARIWADDALSSLATQIAAAFRLRGVFCFQVMRLADTWMLTDLNPRPGAGTSMCQAAGSDFHAANFALAWGEDHSRHLMPLPKPVFVTRQYADFFHGESP
jgi:carbamoylphosphate synthase large subunit